MTRLLILLALLTTNLYSTEKRAKAFAQQQQADAVFHFWHWDQVTLSKPQLTTKLTARTIKQELAKLKLKKDMAVIILDKRMAPDGKEVASDALVFQFQRLGFKRVVIQQAIGHKHKDGLPIIRDTQLDQSKILIPLKAKAVLPKIKTLVKGSPSYNDLIKVLGRPHSNRGSGIYILEYTLDDSSVLRFGTADKKTIFYIDLNEKRIYPTQKTDTLGKQG